MIVQSPSPRSSLIRFALHAYSFGYLLIAGLCLVNWNHSERWSRFDRFACIYLLLRLTGSVHSLLVSRKALEDSEVRKEWWGGSSDPNGITRVVVLMIADLAIFLDYGHWHLTPFLERHLLQTAGLIVYFASATWQIWTDAYLANFFGGTHRELQPLASGPYTYVRHPRYLAAVAGKVAGALIFASAIGWLLALVWGVLLLRKVEREEIHLRARFGKSYEAYEQRTFKLLPGVY